MIRFLNALFWEVLQNLPVIVLLVWAVWLWAREKRKAAVACILAGSAAGALIIRLTEPLTSGYHEPWSVTITNLVAMALLQGIIVVYVGSEVRWSNWKADLLIGAGIGVLLAVAQGIASQGSPLVGILLHSVALGVTGGLTLIGIRMTKDKESLKMLWGALLITAAISLTISIIDYSYLMFVGQ